MSDFEISDTFFKLEDDANTEIRYIYHISDVHIRNIQRHIEYKEVFSRTYRTLRKEIGNKSNKSLIVITGDVMHTKTELSPEAINIAYHFFANLAEITSVVIIAGNHDCNVSNKTRLDALSPIVEDVSRLKNLYYLKRSGVYQYYNLIFGVTSILDDVLISARKIGSKIWKNVKQKNKYKIALYHGPVHGAKTDVGYRMNNSELLAKDFEGYDYVLLGDIHKYQYMNEEQTIAYAGSLIQQSYGESLNKHGILKWDLYRGKSELIEIKNNYGYCTIDIVDGQMVETQIPSKPRIRFILENTNQLQYQEILKGLENEYHICEIIKESNFKSNMTSRKKLNQKVTAYATQENIIESYLEKKNLDQNTIKSIMELHKQIYQKVLKENKYQSINISKNQRWKLLELKFTNTLSYGEDNIIDFRNYDINKIIGIVAPNHCGKSAILDIILFCLFDRCSRGERRDILNKNKRNMYCSILFSIGKQKYLIERIGQRNKNGLTVKIDVNFYLLDQDEQIIDKLNGIDKNDTNKKIVELIGDYNDYLITCFCLQGKYTNFIDMTQLQKKEYLNEILKLNVFEDCHNSAKEKTKNSLAQLKILEQKVGMKSIKELKKNIKKLSLDINELEEQKEETNYKINEINQLMENLEQPVLIKYDQLSEYDLDTENDIIHTIATIKEKLENMNFNQNIPKWKKEVSELKNRLNIAETEVNKCDNLKDLIFKKEKLLKKIINVPEDYDDVNMIELEQSKEEMKRKITEIDKSLNQLMNINLDQKINSMDQLKQQILNLRRKLKPTNHQTQKILLLLQNKFKKNQDIILSLTDKIGIPFLNDNQRAKLKHSIKIKNSFERHVVNNLQCLNDYHFGSHQKNDQVIANLVTSDQKWLDDHQEWLKKSYQLIKIPDINLEAIMDQSQTIIEQMLEYSIDYFNDIHNGIIDDQINKLQEELNHLSTFIGTKRELDNLSLEKNLLQERISIIDNKIKEMIKYYQYQQSNDEIQKEIDQLQNEIDVQNKIQIKKAKQINDLKDQISIRKSEIEEYQDSIIEREKMFDHLRLLERYHLIYLSWLQQTEIVTMWTKSKKELTEKHHRLESEMYRMDINLKSYQGEIKEYLNCREKFDQKSNKCNIYQLYSQTMNYNGMPYEILKTYLPLIESDVNRILHSMVDFNIEFMYFDENQLEEQKLKQIKSNIGCIDINISYQGSKPYNVQLASGFEKFIIGLAIRITLCQISFTAKPNFFIIDEGWSCLDTDNLNNIDSMMNYIRSQYEHVILISHLEELKHQSDYIINIEKQDGYSFIKTENKLTIKRPKNTKSSEIIDL